MRESIMINGAPEGEVIAVQLFSGKTYIGNLTFGCSVRPVAAGNFDEHNCNCGSKESIILSACMELIEIAGPHGQFGVGIVEACPCIEGDPSIEFPISNVMAAGTPPKKLANLYTQAAEKKRAKDAGLIIGGGNSRRISQ